MKQYLLSSILNHLYPSECPSCGGETDNVSFAPFCLSCWSGIKRYAGPSCSICCVPLTSEFGHTCSSCLKKMPPFSRAASFGVYEGVLAEAIHAYKFQGIRRLHRPLGDFLLSCDAGEADAVVPVPLSISKLRERGFNQSLLLAKAVSKAKRIQLLSDGLLRDKDRRPQIGLSASERAANIRGVFRASREFKGLRLMLVDDVMTTGATARECSKELLKAGALEVSVLTLARAALR